MRFDILTLFPEMFSSYWSESILKRAQSAELLQLHLHNFREYATDKHKTADDTPFGGGGGMVLKPAPIFDCVEAIVGTEKNVPIILMTPQGRPFTQRVAEELVQHPRLVLICGRYEGFDERIRQHLATDEISLGDYVLTGGELAAMVIVDAVARLIPGVLGFEDAAAQDSHATGLLEGPHYTKPISFRGWEVPPILRSGNLKAISRLHREQALRRTWERRPDLLLSAELSPEDQRFLYLLAQETTPPLP